VSDIVGDLPSELESGHRPHLSIGEVLALLQDDFPDVTISKIRFLESQGLLDPERTPSGYRKFYDDDIARLRWILAQQRDNFLPLKVIKERLAAATTAADLDASPVEQPEPREAPSQAAEPERVGHSPEPAPEPEPTEPVPVPDRAALADALERRAAERAVTEVSLTRAELAAAAGLVERDVDALESFGLIAGRSVGREVIYDGNGLLVARLAAGFIGQGLEVRHLRMFKVAAEREAGVFEQLVAPLVRQRNPESRRRTAARLDELAHLGHELRDALLRQALRSITGS
jgi:DNA-binding transcriptional MerR regulator